jgi:hypothetical protein
MRVLRTRDAVSYNLVPYMMCFFVKHCVPTNTNVDFAEITKNIQVSRSPNAGISVATLVPKRMVLNSYAVPYGGGTKVRPISWPLHLRLIWSCTESHWNPTSRGSVVASAWPHEFASSLDGWTYEYRY